MFYRNYNSERIPLLLSKSSLKKTKALVDIANDKITIFDKEINLYVSTSGHYCINIPPTEREKENYEKVLILEKDLPNKEKNSQIIKMHKQFGYVSVDNIKKLIINTGLCDKYLCTIIENAVQFCDTYIRFKRVPPRPAVGLAKQKILIKLYQLISMKYIQDFIIFI